MFSGQQGQREGRGAIWTWSLRSRDGLWSLEKKGVAGSSGACSVLVGRRQSRVFSLGEGQGRKDPKGRVRT